MLKRSVQFSLLYGIVSLPSAISNISSQSLLNASSTTVPAFSYIIPFNQTQDCNIYGPICQTGSITVGVNLTTTTTNSVLPCSSYLSAQATHLLYEQDPGDPVRGFWADEDWDGSDLAQWNPGFGQSPECRSYAEAMQKGQYTFSVCGSSNTVVQTAGGLDFEYPAQIPPGVARYFSPEYQGTCCGNCSLDIPQVRLYYFPGKATACQHNQTSNITSTLPAQQLEKRIHSLVANGSTAVVDGHTFTSPSIYVQLLGTATVSDRCTTVGPKLIDPIITLTPGQLSTWKPPVNNAFYEQIDNFTIGEIWNDPSGIPGTSGDFAEGFALLNVEDLACPTWGLGTSTSADGTVVTTIGPPWLPLIVPPEEIFSLDPIWSVFCTGLFTDSFGLTTFALFDPPIALTPSALLVPTSVASPTSAPATASADPTTVSEWTTPSTKAAEPALSPTDPAASPTRKGDPEQDSPTQSPETASLTPLEPTSPPDDPATSPDDKGDPPPDPPSDPKVPSFPAGVEDPSAQSIAHDPPLGGSQESPTDPKESTFPIPAQGGSPQIQSQDLGAIIYNAFGRSGPNVDGSSTAPSPPQPIFAVGAQTFTANPTGFKVNNAAITPGGIAHIVDGTAISLGQSGILAIGSSTISLTNPSSTAILSVAGHTFTPNPSAFSVGGSIVSAGGPAVTVDGTAISLDPSGVLAFGRSTISLTPPSPTSIANDAFTVAGQTFTPNPTAFSIAGTTLSADGPAATISGTIVSLGQHGTLIIGSSTISLPNPSDTSRSKVFTVAGQKFTPNPSAFSIAGTTISAGGPGVTIDGTIISLGPSGALAIGSSTVNLPTSAHIPNKAYTIADQTFTPNPSAFPIAGTVLSAGGPAATIDGTIISLGISGALAIGSSTVDLPSSTYIPGKAYTIADQTFTPNPSAFPIAGTILSAGGPAATVSGTTISLQPSGTLVVGSSTIPLLPSQFPFDVTIDGYDVVKSQSPFAVVDGITLSAAASGVTISGQVVSLEAGGETLDVGTGRFALPTGVGNDPINVQAFTGGGQGMKRADWSLFLFLSVAFLLCYHSV